MTFNPDEAKRLAIEAREDEERMTPGPWDWTDDGQFLFNVATDEGVLNHGECHWPVSEGDRNAISRMRNRNASVAEMLEEACELDRAYDTLLAEKRAMAEERNAALAEVGRLTKGQQTLTEAWLFEQKRANAATIEHDFLQMEVGRLMDEPSELAETLADTLADLHGAMSERDAARAELERLTRDRDSWANSDFERQLDEARAECERMRAVYEAAKTWCETVYLDKPHPRFPAYPGDELLHAVNAVKFAAISAATGKEKT